MNYNDIIPLPKIINNSRISLPLKKGIIEIKSDFKTDRLLKTLNAVKNFNIKLLIKKYELDTLPEIPQKAVKESYVLEISKEKILIKSLTEQGAFYAIKTLLQLLENQNTLPVINIQDWPDMEIRGMHMTLGSGNMPSFEKMKEIILKYADYKLNTFVIEYDNRFPWKKHPALVHESTFTRDQIIELIALAEDNFIELIPLLDSLGHAEHYLIHEQYSYLRELPEHINEMCPCNPKTMIFIKELWEEILDIHKNSRYAHITGDEVFRMGDFCPECKKYARQGKLADLYAQYYRNLSNWIKSKGKIPIIWGDMLIKYPEYINEFPKDIIINDWLYYGVDADYWNFCHARANPEGFISKERLKTFETYWHQDGDKNKFTPYPFYKFFKDHGFKTIAASAVGRAIDAKYPVSSFYQRFANNKQFAATVVKNNGEGLIGTFWSVSSMAHSTWFGALSGAEFTWHFHDVSYEEFAKKFSVNFLRQSKIFGTKIMELGSRLYPENTGFISLSQKKTEPFDPFPDFKKTGNSAADTYVKILAMINGLNILDTKISEKTMEIDRLFLGTGNSEHIDISKSANSSISTCMPEKAPAFSMKSGTQEIMGMEFNIDVDKLITIVKGDNRYPDTVCIDINRQFEEIIFVTNAHSAGNGTGIAQMKIEYVNGNHEHYPFIAGDNTADWWDTLDTSADPANGILAWQGYTVDAMKINAYLGFWKNPEPDTVIKSLQFKPASEEPRLIIYAINGITEKKIYKEKKNISKTRKSLSGLELRLLEMKKEILSLYKTLMSEADAKKAVEKLIGQRENVINGSLVKLDKLI